MADKKLMVDSTILIDYFRKTDKEKSRLVNCQKEDTKERGKRFYIITIYCLK